MKVMIRDIDKSAVTRTPPQSAPENILDRTFVKERSGLTHEHEVMARFGERQVEVEESLGKPLAGRPKTKLGFERRRV